MAACTADEILKLAVSQLGTKESPAGSNNVKYNTAYYGRAVSGNYAWCCVFVWWLFQQLGAKELFYNGSKTASCTTLMTYAKKNGLWVTSNFKPGDLILYNWSGKTTYAEHVGVCESATSDAVTCIEGNTSITNNDNGGNVMRRVRSKKLVVGAYRPKYKVVTSSTSQAARINLGNNLKKGETVTVDVPVLKKGSNNSTVRALQAMLNGFGYNCGTVDGDFGTKTDTAVRKYQKAKGLTVDGSVGPKTWKKLLGV